MLKRKIKGPVKFVLLPQDDRIECWARVVCVGEDVETVFGEIYARHGIKPPSNVADTLRNTRNLIDRLLRSNFVQTIRMLAKYEI